MLDGILGVSLLTIPKPHKIAPVEVEYADGRSAGSDDNTIQVIQWERHPDIAWKSL
jgi:hypothetical protein